jgi:hypothetical protein
LKKSVFVVERFVLETFKKFKEIVATDGRIYGNSFRQKGIFPVVGGKVATGRLTEGQGINRFGLIDNKALTLGKIFRGFSEVSERIGER